MILVGAVGIFYFLLANLQHICNYLMYHYSLLRPVLMVLIIISILNGYFIRMTLCQIRVIYQTIFYIIAVLILVFCDFSSRCYALACSVRLRYFLTILTFSFTFNSVHAG